MTDAESNTIRIKITATKNKGGFKDLIAEIEVTATMENISSVIKMQYNDLPLTLEPLVHNK